MKPTASLCLIALYGVALAYKPSSGFKTFMQGMVPRVAHAYEAKDVAFFDRSTTPDFTENLGGHVVIKTEALDTMRLQFRAAKSVTCQLRLLSATSKGPKGNATIEGNIRVLTTPVKGGKSHVFSAQTVEKETWVKVPGGWKLRSIDDVKQSKMTLDGKPVGQEARH